MLLLHLFGLAPSGVYNARFVTNPPVCFYHSFSPLPKSLAVYFLLHFPSKIGRIPEPTFGWPLTSTIFPWSPDFPQVYIIYLQLRNYPNIYNTYVEQIYQGRLITTYLQKEVNYFSFCYFGRVSKQIGRN